MNPTTNPSTNPSSPESARAMTDGIDHLASRVDRSLQHVQQLAGDAVQTLANQAGAIRDETASAMSHAAHTAQKAQDMAHRGIDKARDAVAHARHSASELRDQTSRRVQADPMKAVLIAAAAGAATALLLQWVAHARQPR